MARTAKSLLDAALGGDARAGRALFAALTPVIQTAVARELYRNRRAIARGDARELVADQVQEVWAELYRDRAKALKAWRSDGGATLETWVARIAQRRTIDLLKSRRTNPTTEEPTEAEGLGRLQGHTGDAAGAMEQRMLLRQIDERLRAGLDARGEQLYDELLVRQRAAKEVAAELDMSTAAVFGWKTRLRAEARRIRDALLSRGGGAMTDDDRLLDEVAAEARRRVETEEPDPEWDALARGLLDDAETETLRERAQHDHDGDDDAMAWALFEPLSEEDLGGAEAGLLAALAEGRAAEDEPEEESLLERWLGWLGRLGPWIALPVAAAAAVMLLSPGSQLPQYTLAPVVGDATVRAADPSPEGLEVRLTPASTLELLLKPAARPDKEVSVQLFVGASGQTAARVELGDSARITDAGVVRISSTAGALVGPRRGTLELLIAVGPAEDMTALDPASPAATVQLFRQPVHVLDAR